MDPTSYERGISGHDELGVPLNPLRSYIPDNIFSSTGAAAAASSSSSASKLSSSKGQNAPTKNSSALLVSRGGKPLSPIPEEEEEESSVVSLSSKAERQVGRCPIKARAWLVKREEERNVVVAKKELRPEDIPEGIVQYKNHFLVGEK